MLRRQNFIYATLFINAKEKLYRAPICNCGQLILDTHFAATHKSDK